MAVAADLSVAHQCTLTWDGLPAVTRTYTANFAAGADSWTAGAAGTTIGWPTLGGGITINVTSTATGYATRTVTVGSPLIALRVRAMVQLFDPTERPVKVWVADQLGNGGTQAGARFVGATPVEIVQDLPNNATTGVRIFTAKATGAATAAVQVLSVTFDRVPNNIGQDWSVVRTDANGTKTVATWLSNQANSSGVATIVDRDASLRGNVTWVGGPPTAQTIVRTLTSTGNAVVTGPTGAILDGILMSYRMRRTSGSTAHQVINRPDPLVALAVAAARAGTFTIRVTSSTAVDDLTDLLGTAVTLWLRVPDRDRIDLWFALTDVEVTPVLTELATPYWDVTVSCVEVARPTS